MIQLLPNGEFTHSDPGLGALIEQLNADIQSVQRKFPSTWSNHRITASRRLIRDWEEVATKIETEGLTSVERADLWLIRWFLRNKLSELDQCKIESDRLQSIFPFADSLLETLEIAAPEKHCDPKMVAERLEMAAKEIAKLNKETVSFDGVAADFIGELNESFLRWKEKSAPYSPELQWWTKVPIQAVVAELQTLVDRVQAGQNPISPLGRDAILAEIEKELISETPESLIAIGEKEYAKIVVEMEKASSELGFGNDWRAALESVKNGFIQPGRQAEGVAALAEEAIRFLEDRGLVTLPDLAKSTWRLDMMSAEMQKTNPFFLGGECIMVSYPTIDMTHEEKLMSARGNNLDFSRATVQHELIPGHHLQQFMTKRYRPYRKLFSTPFWIEGWTLYWELLLWELGFPQTPAQKLGMLFWRAHRAVRIVFSLGYHLGLFSYSDCVDMLVDRVGHERANAEGEVKRSFNGRYPPLYQAAYMLGGLMFKQMSDEFVASGERTLREFHDTVLLENNIHPALLREIVNRREVSPGQKLQWTFTQD